MKKRRATIARRSFLVDCLLFVILQLAAASTTARATITTATLSGREAGTNGEGRDSDHSQNARNDSFHCNSPFDLTSDSRVDEAMQPLIRSGERGYEDIDQPRSEGMLE